MTVVEPSKRKSTTSDSPRGFEILIPAARHIFAMLFLPVWLAGWFFGEVHAIEQLASGEEIKDSVLFLSFWLMGWTIGGAIAIGLLLWMLLGQERIALTSTALSIRREILGIGRTREYELVHIRNLRVAPRDQAMFGSTSNQGAFGLGAGSIAFDHGASTIRFGASLDEAEATQVVADLSSRRPFAR